ncbi:rhomboid family intramembrane serine protease [Leptospira sarikeiensis]|uniref:Rhomboid family intramembrane serine protease n=1 Tax=Leptospira sarikeiensis TaxID=2484943 RepID=A0A4R9KCW1_9LEPT|nr:rhomboid family intramembrane serine protease [Leptospira sarikeiensis]TGL64910.1 rhomboid family intramembrane serine protease [Leptospira sarikeiensis]
MASFSSGFGVSTSPLVRKLLILNIAIFGIEFILSLTFPPILAAVFGLFGLTPGLVIGKFFVWQLLSYSFIHTPSLWFLFEMLAFWMFGSALESHWGTRNFLRYFMFCILGGGVASLLASLVGFSQGIVIGMSAVLYGLITAYALIWPNRELLFWGIFPIKAKYLAVIILVILVLAGLQSGSPIANGLGGFAAGGLYFLYYTKIKYRFGIKLPSFSFSRWRQKRKMVRWQEEMKTREQAKEEVDRILEKISKEGMNSLNKKEKKFLKEASSKYYKTED